LTVEEDDVRDGEDGIVLTEREREVLAGLAESIGDPWLAGQLAGGEHSPAPTPRRPRRWPSAGTTLAGTALGGWIGLLLVVAGATLAATTFIHSTVVASLGLAVMGVGLWRLAVDRGEVIVGRLRAAAGWRRGQAGAARRADPAR
jgi:hypothetical protein